MCLQLGQSITTKALDFIVALVLFQSLKQQDLLGDLYKNKMFMPDLVAEGIY